MTEAAKDVEKSMRRVEIKKPWKREKSEISPSEMLALSLDFMAHAMETNDYRFLNTALKLNDRLRKEDLETNQLMKIEEREHHCLETLKKRLGLMG